MMWWVDPAKLKTIDAKRICIIKPSALGDVIQAIPVLRAVRERFTNAHISWVISKSLSPLLEDHPYLDESISWQRKGGALDHLRLARSLAAKKFDLVFDLQGLMRTGVMTAATRAKYRVGLQTARECSSVACNLILPNSDKDVPAGQRYWRVAEAIGCDPDQMQSADIEVGSENRRWAIEALSGLSRPLIAINPGARWATKRWPIESFANVALAAGRDFGCSVAILGDKTDHDICSRLQTLLTGSTQFASGRVVNLCGKTSLKQLSAVLEQSTCVVTNDSGPMHLAHAMGTRVVGIFLCTSSLRSGPPGDQHRLVSTEVGCAASYKKNCPNSGAKHLCCMSELAVGRVWSALREQLDITERCVA